MTDPFLDIPKRPIVCVQGLGFVGTAMALAVAHAKNEGGEPLFNVIGVELPNPMGIQKVTQLNEGTLPFKCEDPKLGEALSWAKQRRNFVATTSTDFYAIADVVLVDIHCDIKNLHSDRPEIQLDGLKSSMTLLARTMKKGSLVVVETTVPPGICEKVLLPILIEGLKARGLKPGDVGLAHSYERVMPGKKYFDSIRNFWRVYAGVDEDSAKKCGEFLSQVVNVTEFPLTRLDSTTASETAKVLENSYRAMNIAFIEEWGRFAEAANIDLFSVIEAIRMRPTHNNIRQPGFSVGGYCLTKDPLFAALAAKQIFDRPDLQFPFSRKSVEVNRQMPLVSLEKLRKHFGGSLNGKRLLLLGVSYIADVADTRNSGSQVFLEKARELGAEVLVQDPLVDFWPEMQMNVQQDLPSPNGLDAVVFTQAHASYLKQNWAEWLGPSKPLIFDTNNVLPKNLRAQMRQHGCQVISIGRGVECG